MVRSAIVAAFLALAAGGAAAQEARVTSTADTNAFLIGDQVRVTVTVDHPAMSVVRGIAPADSLRGIEIIRIDTSAASGPAVPGPTTRVYTITAFDTGTFVLPAFTASYGLPTDRTLRSATGNPLVFTVMGVDVDTAGDIRSIKPPLEVPLTLAELLPYLIGTALAVLLGWLVYHMLKKRRRGEAIIPAAPPRPADELALEALRSIEAERLWQRGLVKEYHSALSDVLRTYIERRCAMPAMESTSDEILSSAQVSALVPPAVGALRDVLSRADLAKFAKLVPPPAENEKSFSEAVSFVELTRRDAAPAVPPPSAAGAASPTPGPPGAEAAG